MSKTHGGKLLLLQSPPFWTIIDKTGIDKNMEIWVKFRANSKIWSLWLPLNVSIEDLYNRSECFIGNNFGGEHNLYLSRSNAFRECSLEDYAFVSITCELNRNNHLQDRQYTRANLQARGLLKHSSSSHTRLTLSYNPIEEWNVCCNLNTQSSNDRIKSKSLKPRSESKLNRCYSSPPFCQ